MNHSSLNFSRYRLRCHIVAAFVSLLFGGIQYFASTSKTAALRADLNARLNQRQSLVNQSKTLTERMQSLQAEEMALRTELESLRQQVPFKADNHAFIENLAHQAQDAGLEVLEFQPGRANADHKFEKVPIRISAICNWAQLCQFLFKFKDASRLCTVDELRVATPDGNSEELQVNLTIGIFSAIPQMMAQSEEGTLE